VDTAAPEAPVRPETPLLEVSGLRVYRGGVKVLEIPRLTLQDREVKALIGPNGAGKSTLLLALARLLPVTGRVLFHGRETENGTAALAYRRRSAMVFQEPLLFDTTVFHNVATGLKLRGMKGRDIRRRVGETLERFGISHLADRHARALSGGEAQRVSLARAFAVQPEIIFLDEPFSSLDPPTREGLTADLGRILAETGTAAVMATHDRIEALRLADTLLVMRQGNIVQEGPPQEVMNRPADAFVASFVGMETIISGEVEAVEEGTVTIATAGGYRLEAVGNRRLGERVMCCVRPEHVTLSPAPPASASARNRLGGRVRRIEPLGFVHRVAVDAGFPISAYVTSPALQELSLKEGSFVWVSFKASAVLVFPVETTPALR